MTPEKIAVMDPALVATCRRGEAVTQEQLVDALGKRAVLGAQVAAVLRALRPAAVADHADHRRLCRAAHDGEPNPNNYRDWLTYTWAFNLTRNPSASIPCGFADGLPIGLMVTGPLYDDLAVLQACRAYEEAAAPVWPSPELAAALANAQGAAGPAVKAKIKPAAALS